MIGMQDKFIAGEGPRLNIPRNLKIIGFIPRLQLLKYYIEARVFCLFSLTEGMSNVLCEAMLCECVPVGSNVTFIPEIIGDCGFVVTHRDIEEMKNKVEAAMQSDPSMGKRARQRILDNYSLKTREKTLCNLINEELKTE
jgi:glycosyltransferase involved in cell wall biosynthesis